MKYNSHTMQFILLACTIQWFLFAELYTINFGIFSSPQKEITCPLASVLYFPQLATLAPGNYYFLSLWICLFGMFHINVIIYSPVCQTSLP